LEEYGHKQLAGDCIGLEAAVHGSGISLQKLIMIMNIIHMI